MFTLYKLMHAVNVYYKFTEANKILAIIMRCMVLVYVSVMFAIATIVVLKVAKLNIYSHSEYHSDYY